jgi:hypothetical protein
VSKWLNTVGLIVGIFGVVLLFVWAPPQPSFQHGASVSLEDNTTPNGKTVAQNNAKIEPREAHYGRMSQIGLLLIGLGFGFQLWGVCSS